MSSQSTEPGTAARDLIELHFTVPEHNHGWRLDHFIQAQVPRLSRNRIQKMIRAQHSYCGASLRPSQRVHAGQAIRLWRPAPDEPDVPREFDVLFEDQSIIAVNKPAGLPVHATARFHRNTLMALVRERYGEQDTPRLVHRIDKETSGVLLLARSGEVEVALKGLFARRELNKTYQAIVHGHAPEQTCIDGPIGQDEALGIRVRRCIRPDGQPAQTHVRRVDQLGDFSLVEATPVSGRQHQIRVHLASIGHPIVGDKLYGPDPTLFLEHLECGWNERLAERLILERHALHAARLAFRHPETNADHVIEAPLPRELSTFWAGLT